MTVQLTMNAFFSVYRKGWTYTNNGTFIHKFCFTVSHPLSIIL